MKGTINPFIIIIILVFFISCTRNSNIVRELHYVDLLSPENQSFHRYPNEFSTYLLEGILKEKLKAYHIDYDSSGQISGLELSDFIDRILEPYEDYSPGESTIVDEYTMDDANQFLSSVTLIAFDNVSSNDQNLTKYISFYHPGDVTLDGINRYICSVEYEFALEYLESRSHPLIWHNYKVADWGWFNDRLFHSQFQSFSNLAIDMINLSDSAVLTQNLSENISYDMAKQLVNNNPYMLNSKLDISGEGNFTISYNNDSIFYEIASFTFSDIDLVAEKKILEDSVIIIPITSAILGNRLTPKGKTASISQNGKFKSPLEGNDPLSSRDPGDLDFEADGFGPSQKFYFRTIERLIGENNVVPENMPNLLYQGVKKGLITVYRSDSLKTRLLPGNFFDNMILDEQDNIPADIGHLRVYQVVVETVFLHSGKIEKQTPIGIGLFIPGAHVPEGLNRPIGYFSSEETNQYLESIDQEKIVFEDLRGYPLKSWNIQLLD